MSDNPEVTVTVHMVHGDPIKFRAPVTPDRLIGLGDDIERAATRNTMLVELDGKLVLIPYSSIRYVEIDPAPDGLPLTMIRHAVTVAD